MLVLWLHLRGKVSVLVQTASDSNMWEQRWPFGRSTKMHRHGANILILVVLISTVYITWSIAASRFGLEALGANHASVKVTMASLRRTTVFCNHLPQ